MENRIICIARNSNCHCNIDYTRKASESIFNTVNSFIECSSIVEFITTALILDSVSTIYDSISGISVSEVLQSVSIEVIKASGSSAGVFECASV